MVKVLQYPVLPLATRYPTIGPSTNAMMMDVNGLAGSIELYFGRDVLQRGTELVPRQWKGFDEGLRRYQGEITDKAGVQQRFEKKLRRAQRAVPGLHRGPRLDRDEFNCGPAQAGVSRRRPSRAP